MPRFLGQRITARSQALETLAECRHGDLFAQDILNRRFEQLRLSPADRRLVAQLVYGVLRRRATLDALLRPLVARPAQKVEPWLRDVLRVGTFQLALLSHIPRHAAVHETVQLAADFGRPKAKGFINGILRGIDRLLTEERASRPAADLVPVAEGEYRRLRRAVLPDPGTCPIEYFAAAFSLPSWLAERWLGRYAWDECLRLGFWFAGPAPLWLRSNPVRITRSALLDALNQEGVQAQLGEHAQAICVREGPPVRELPGFQEGWFTVQDQSAMSVASALAPQPGDRVLDLCAAPGGKTTHLAELMQNRGTIVACDVDPLRLQKVDVLCRRLGLTIVQTHLLQRENTGQLPAGPYDAALVDVPCSNTGVLGRRPEVRWRLKPASLKRLVLLQTALLLKAAALVRPRGVLVYSTCSVEPEENGRLVRAIVETVPGLALEAEEEQIPGRPADAGYWARLRKKAE